MPYYIRYTQHNDRSGLLDALAFFGPYDTFDEARRSIPTVYEPYEAAYGSEYVTNTWCDNLDESHCFYTIVESLPISARLGINNEPAQDE